MQLFENVIYLTVTTFKFLTPFEINFSDAKFYNIEENK